MKYRYLGLLCLLFASSASMAANLWRAEGSCTDYECGFSLPPGVQVEFNLFLDDSTLSAGPGAIFADPAQVLAFQAIIDPGEVFAPAGTFPDSVSLGAQYFLFFTPAGPGDPAQSLYIGGTEGEFCSNPGPFFGSCAAFAFEAANLSSANFEPFSDPFSGWVASNVGGVFAGVSSAGDFAGLSSPAGAAPLEWTNIGFVETVPGVPIPAAAWLFGSALLGLGVIKRKKA